MCCLQPALHEVLSRDSFCAPEVDIFHAVKRWSEHNPEENTKSVIEVCGIFVCVHSHFKGLWISIKIITKLNERRAYIKYHSLRLMYNVNILYMYRLFVCR